MDVGRQWDFTHSFEDAQNILRAFEAESPVALVIGFQNSCANVCRFSVEVADDNFCADASAFARSKHDPPIVVCNLFEQQYFELATAVSVDSAKPGRNHSGVIQYQNISRPDEVE